MKFIVIFLLGCIFVSAVLSVENGHVEEPQEFVVKSSKVSKDEEDEEEPPISIGETDDLIENCMGLRISSYCYNLEIFLFFKSCSLL